MKMTGDLSAPMQPPYPYQAALSSLNKNTYNTVNNLVFGTNTQSQAAVTTLVSQAKPAVNPKQQPMNSMFFSVNHQEHSGQRQSIGSTESDDPSVRSADDFIHAGAILYTIVETGEQSHDLLFLLGKEHDDETWEDGGKWSAMGGKPEKGETLLEAAAREVYEEGMGVFGTKKEIQDKLRKCEYVYSQTPRDFYGNTGKLSSITYLMPTQYVSQLPNIWKSMYQYIEQGFSRAPIKSSPSHARTKSDSDSDDDHGFRPSNNRSKYKKYKGNVPSKATNGVLHLKAEEGFFEKTEIAWIFASDLHNLVIKAINPDWYKRHERNLKWVNPEVAHFQLREPFARTMNTIYERYPEFRKGQYHFVK